MTWRRILLVSAGALAAVIGAAAVAWPSALLNALTSRKGYTVERDIAYGTLPRQSFDLYLPEADAADAPVLIFFYGGSWTSGEKATFRFAGQTFASRGFIVAIPDYRLYPEVTFPGFVEDGAAAVAHIARTVTKADGKQRPIFLMGHSAGAEIATLIALDDRYLAAAGAPRPAIAGVIGLSGPYDFLPLRSAKNKAVFPEAVRAASQPINFVDRRDPPMLLLTGDADRTVDPANSTRLAARMTEAGGTATVRIYPGVGHMGTITALAEVLPIRKPPVREDVIRFINERLGR